MRDTHAAPVEWKTFTVDRAERRTDKATAKYQSVAFKNGSIPTQMCIIVAVIAALAIAAEGTAISSYAVPLAYSVPQTTVVQQNVAPKYVVSGYAAPYVASPYVASPYVAAAVPAVSYASTAVHAVPAVTYAVPQATVYAAPVQQEARYVAANRGAIHEAPLAGHAVNQQSLNLAPAPGTL
uniref:Cuticle protein n=1 Tax=Anopheles culicifacies TaxID=139723 RepID=A0A182M0Y8_9DIPT